MSAFWGVMARLLVVSLLALSLPAKAALFPLCVGEYFHSAK